MRKLAVSLVAISAIALVSPWFVGMKAQSELQNLIARTFDSDKTPEFTAELKEYERGWFKSTATFALSVNLPSQSAGRPQAPYAANTQTVSFKVDIHHGPIIIHDGRPSFGWGLAHLEPMLPPMADTVLNMAFANGPKPRFDTTIFLSFTGNANTQLDMPAFNYKGGAAMAGVSVDWKGLTSRWDFSGRDTLSGTFDYQGVEANGGPASLKIDPIRMTVDAKRYKPDSFWLGKTALLADGIAFTLSPEKSFELSGFTLESESNINGKTFGGPVDMKLTSLTVNRFTSGPAEMRLSLAKIDLDSYDAFYKAMKELNRTSPMEMMAGYRAAVTHLAQTGGELTLDKFSLRVPEGVVTAQGKLTLPPNPAVNDLSKEGRVLLKSAVLEFTGSTPVALVKKAIESELTTSITKAQQAALLKRQQESQPSDSNPPLTSAQIAAQAKTQAEQQLADWVSKNYLVQKGDAYTVHASLKEGQLIVNDKPVYDLNTLIPQS
jgi:uncharacterized protein YdgA (DUF945 family)